jgi:hypothetical protein
MSNAKNTTSADLTKLRGALIDQWVLNYDEGTEALDRADGLLQRAEKAESLLAVAVGAINSILRADVRWRSQNELMFNKQQAERESIASLLKITGLTEQDFAALGIGEGGT